MLRIAPRVKRRCKKSGALESHMMSLVLSTAVHIVDVRRRYQTRKRTKKDPCSEMGRGLFLFVYYRFLGAVSIGAALLLCRKDTVHGRKSTVRRNSYIQDKTDFRRVYKNGPCQRHAATFQYITLNISQIFLHKIKTKNT